MDLFGTFELCIGKESTHSLGLNSSDLSGRFFSIVNLAFAGCAGTQRKNLLLSTERHYESTNFVEFSETHKGGLT